MKAGLFLMPSHPPERAPIEALRWDLDVISQADKLGFSEAWVGEHFTAPWEPVPAPDLLIAQALTRTENIKLGTGAHLLPFHHPVELAHRVAYLDHMAQGRFMFGIGSGGLPTDHEMFNVNMEAGQHREDDQRIPGHHPEYMGAPGRPLSLRRQVLELQHSRSQEYRVRQPADLHDAVSKASSTHRGRRRQPRFGDA